MLLLVSFEDLTEKKLTSVFQEHFNSKALSVKVKEDAREFTGLNDQFQSEIRKLVFKIRVRKVKRKRRKLVWLSRRRQEQHFKGSLSALLVPYHSIFILSYQILIRFQRFTQRVARPFLSEVMWYCQAQAWKKTLNKATAKKNSKVGILSTNFKIIYSLETL